MDLGDWIEDAIKDVRSLSDMCARRGLTLTDRASGDLLRTLQEERQRSERRAPSQGQSNVVAFVPRGAQSPMTGTFLPLLGAADGVA